ncbi:MAG: hypothetical protein ACD_29C00225G0001, partial [uncultured bacterium]
MTIALAALSSAHRAIYPSASTAKKVVPHVPQQWDYSHQFSKYNPLEIHTPHRSHRENAVYSNQTLLTMHTHYWDFSNQTPDVAATT